MNVLFVAVGSLKSQNGYIVRISEEAKLVPSEQSFLSMFVPLKEYFDYVRGVEFPVIDLFSEIFNSIYIFPTVSGLYFHRVKKWHLNRLIVRHCISYIHAESTASGFILGRSKLQPGFTLDLHGFSEYETILRSTIKNRSWIHKKLSILRAKKLDRISISAANKIIAVSNNMKQHLVEKYNVEHGKISVTPCLASNATIINDIHNWESSRQEVRDDLDISSTTIVFGYLGGLGTYQMVEEMLDFFHAYYKINKDSLLLMVVVGDVSQLMDMIENKKMCKVVKIYRDIPHKHVGNYLCATDFGLLFRKNDPVNYYASPTKFGEYLSCGVSIIASLNIGDLEGHINTNSLGIGINEDLKVDQDLCVSIEKVMKNRLKVAENNISWISNHYTWDSDSIDFPVKR
ncbi:glycosyltransferase [Candidatus Thioglobus sp.]|nr:glycosyltransferase [Candidatus Thioglobus sp.]